MPCNPNALLTPSAPTRETSGPVTYVGKSFDLTGPESLAKVAQAETQAIFLKAAGFNPWRDISIHRGGVHLGSLHDTRQAFSWAEAEGDFAACLAYDSYRRTRQVPKRLRRDGFGYLFVAKGAILIRKVRANELHLHDQRIILDFGPALNQMLAACAEPGYAIIALDKRIMALQGGMCVAAGSDVRTATAQGPGHFGTPALRLLAGGGVWSKGHAHLGPAAFGITHISQQGGYMITSAEEMAVMVLVIAYVIEHIRHWPTFVNRAQYYPGIPPTEYPQQFVKAANGKWIVDIAAAPANSQSLTHLPPRYGSPATATRPAPAPAFRPAARPRPAARVAPSPAPPAPAASSRSPSPPPSALELESLAIWDPTGDNPDSSYPPVPE